MTEFLSNYPNILPLGVLLLTAVATAFVIPTVVSIAKTKQLVDIPNGRSSHSGNVPSLGGFAVFLPLSIIILLFLDFSRCFHCQFFMVGLLIMVFVGLKDDIMLIDPLKKLLAQIFAAVLLVVFGGVQFSNLHGFLGIYEISPFIGALLTIFVIVVITNSFNLIDGIDGLASGIGIIASMALGIWFVLVGEVQLAIISFAIIGGFAVFFYFNTSKGKNKIFMGDTGSLILGFSLAYLIVHFNELNLIEQPYQVAAAPAVSFGILIVPLFDTLRVFIIRALKGESPFSPDKLHVHHRLLFLKKSHIKATVSILVFNLIFTATVFLLQNIGTLYLLLTEVALAIIFSYLPVYLIRRKEYEAFTSKEKKEYEKMKIHPFPYSRVKAAKREYMEMEA